ncbi:ABC transporter permease [Dysosmobacter sp.]|uniref:ABC transporter permease n=1 Tax=Dysosmobacter sp. TaxID=2591382 RepID=UPI002A89AEBE|nr:ABC transporter permease [Dysosmobacter sp.]MDY3985188.1 ABC transporter permease [Dysosmobacter sp.]
MNIRQAFKMAWKSIWGKKGRSALTILGIFIGIAAVMTIVSVMEGMKQKSMEQFEAMGTNRITVDIYSWSWDEEGNQISKDYFPDLYDYCNSLKEYVVGTTPTAWANVTVTYGTKSSANMEWEYDDNWNVISAPPDQFYGSDQYSVCNNLTIAKGRDLAYLDVESYHQVCVLGAKAARIFFGTADPVGKIMQVNGQNFEVVGVYAARVDPDSSNAQMDNFIVYPYTARRVLGGGDITQFLVKARDSESMTETISRLGGFLKGLVDQNTGGYNVYSESRWQEQSNEYLTMISLVLGGIAAISLVVGGIGIMNIMLVTVTERTREIGIRRAIGAQRSSIVAQFLIEAAMLCGIGGIIGILVGTLGSVVLSTLLMQMTIYPPVKVTIGAFALSVALGIIFGIYPAAKASKLQPVEALRAE